MDYTKEIKSLDETIFSKMRICSFDLACKDFEIDFASANKHELYKLYKDKKELSSYFSIPGSQENALKIYLPKEKYDAEVFTLQKSLIFEFVVVVLLIALLSIFFAIYTLSPLRNALKLTEEFIKDILHDFNTPLSTMRLNVSMLKSELPENSKIKRIENSIQNILSLQTNLRSYLTNHTAQKESFLLSTLLEERVALIDSSYKDITFSIDVYGCELDTNREAFTRIVDNLLTNAAKYNKESGSVTMTFSKKVLKITDTGKGIKSPKKVFERFYKEQERGIGIGLHIVKKLCDELSIGISLESKLDIGSTFSLNLKDICN